MRVRTDRWRRGVPRAQIVKISVHFFRFHAAIIYQIVSKKMCSARILRRNAVRQFCASFSFPNVRE